MKAVLTFPALSYFLFLCRIGHLYFRKLECKFEEMSWKDQLLQYIKNPQDPGIILSSKNCIAIKDKFPKAIHHFLIIPVIRIDTLYELGEEHIALLEDMKSMGDSVVKENSDGKSRFRMGFHKVPSMNQLHL
jgi:aprataxin